MAAPARYWELTLTVPPAATEGLTNFLWESGALGVVEEERPGESPELRAFFPHSAAPALLSERVIAYADGLAALGFGDVGRPRLVPLEDQAWAEAWREHFRPIAVGRTLVIAPPWEIPAPSDRIVILIEPGRAFGTGHHGSTAGCLEAVERLVGRAVPPRALDLGTGSGILAIALARLGVPHIVAVDADPDAIAAATANAARNDVTAQVACRVDDAAVLEDAPAPLVVANLITAVHRRLAPRYPRHVTPGGALVLGGILDTEADALARTLAADGWREHDRVACEGWTTLVVVRETSAAALHDRA